MFKQMHLTYFFASIKELMYRFMIRDFIDKNDIIIFELTKIYLTVIFNCLIINPNLYFID